MNKTGYFRGIPTLIQNPTPAYKIQATKQA